MKKQTLIISLILLGFCQFQCSVSDESGSKNHSITKEAAASADTLGNTSLIPDTLTYKIETLEKTQPDCEGKECTTVKVVYPYILPGEEGLSAIINQQTKAVLSEMLGGYQPDDQIPPNADLEILAQEIINQYIKAVEEYGEERPWAIEITGEVIYQDDEVLSIALFGYDYMGGVHPNSAQRNICVNLASGNLYMLGELVDNYDKLTQLAEEAFRTEREISPEEDLNALGYSFPDNQFTLNENFMLTEEGITFHFDPYEIAPYALGPTDILISFERLEGILKK